MIALVQPIILFFTALFGRIGAWFITAYLSGALRSLVISLVLFSTISGLVFTFISQANQYLLEALQGMSPLAQSMISPVASMLPPSLGYCAGIIVSVWLMGMVYNMAKEVAKLKARAAERAAGFFKA